MEAKAHLFSLQKAWVCCSLSRPVPSSQVWPFSIGGDGRINNMASSAFCFLSISACVNVNKRIICWDSSLYLCLRLHLLLLLNLFLLLKLLHLFSLLGLFLQLSLCLRRTWESQGQEDKLIIQGQHRLLKCFQTLIRLKSIWKIMWAVLIH